MQYLIKVTDGAGHKVLFTLEESDVKHPAIDVVFSVIGAEKPGDLVAAKTISEAQLDDLRALQAQIFDRDAQGPFIREGIGFLANGRELDPDAPFDRAFEQVERDGMTYMRCELVVQTPTSVPEENQEAQMKGFARMMFLHQVGLGHSLDVTKDYPDLGDLIEEAERRREIEVDVPTASYKLTSEGRRVHQAWIDEAQDLIKKYDIYGDVDLDSSGTARFDTGLGKDYRVAVYEYEGVDPFKARFLLGLNDEEWDELDNWRDAVLDPAWYDEIFAPIEGAPTMEDLGRDRLQRMMDQAKALMRRESTYF